MFWFVSWIFIYNKHFKITCIFNLKKNNYNSQQNTDYITSYNTILGSRNLICIITFPGFSLVCFPTSLNSISFNIAKSHGICILYSPFKDVFILMNYPYPWKSMKQTTTRIEYLLKDGLFPENSFWKIYVKVSQ